MLSYLEIPRFIINKSNLNNNNFKEKIKKKYGIIISLFEDTKLIDIEGSFTISKNYKNDIIKFTKNLLLRNNQYNNLNYSINFVNKPEQIFTKNDDLENCFKKFFIKGIHGLIIHYENDCYIYSADYIDDYQTLLKNPKDILLIERFKCQIFKETDTLILDEYTYLYLPLFICYCYYINLIK